MHQSQYNLTATLDNIVYKYGRDDGDGLRVNLSEVDEDTRRELAINFVANNDDYSPDNAMFDSIVENDNEQRNKFLAAFWAALKKPSTDNLLSFADTAIDGFVHYYEQNRLQDLIDEYCVKYQENQMESAELSLLEQRQVVRKHNGGYINA